MKLLEAINPIHLEHLPESKLKAEEYLQRFGEYVAEIGEQSGYGDKKNLVLCEMKAFMTSPPIQS